MRYGDGSINPGNLVGRAGSIQEHYIFSHIVLYFHWLIHSATLLYEFKKEHFEIGTLDLHIVSGYFELVTLDLQGH